MAGVKKTGGVAPGGDKQKSRRALIEHRTDDDLEVVSK
jgi:hypothetical protein